MYRKPLLASTIGSSGALAKLGISVGNFYDPIFKVFTYLADKHNTNSIQPQDIDVVSLIDNIYIPNIYSVNKDLTLLPPMLQQHPIPTYSGNCVTFRLSDNQYEIAIYHPFVGLTLWLNTTASLVWNRCNSHHTVTQIVDYMQDMFPNADRTTLEKDTISLLETLVNLDLLEWMILEEETRELSL
jgi:hypothetical protein